MAEKRNIFLVGPMGAGKSTIGRQLAQQLNMEFYDSDQEIEKRTGADVGWVFDVEGEEGFRDREEKIINELTEKQGIVLATGGGSVKSRETRNRLSARGVVVGLAATVPSMGLAAWAARTCHLSEKNVIKSKHNSEPHQCLQ